MLMDSLPGIPDREGRIYIEKNESVRLLDPPQDGNDSIWSWYTQLAQDWATYLEERIEVWLHPSVSNQMFLSSTSTGDVTRHGLDPSIPHKGGILGNHQKSVQWRLRYDERILALNSHRWRANRQSGHLRFEVIDEDVVRLQVGWSPQDIADELGMSVGTVWEAIKRRPQARQVYEDYRRCWKFLTREHRPPHLLNVPDKSSGKKHLFQRRTLRYRSCPFDDTKKT